jgi:predicted metalloprotease with PDZ domain
MRRQVRLVRLVGRTLCLALAGAAGPASAAGQVDEYQVEAGSGAAELRIDARLGAVPRGVLIVDPDLGAFIEAEVEEGGAWKPLVRDDDVFSGFPHGRALHVRYRVRLAEAASRLRDRNRALESGGALLAPPSSWLLRPAWEDRAFRMRVSTPEPTRFVTGLFPSSTHPGTFEGQAGDLPQSPYSGFGPFTVDTVTLPGWTVEVAQAGTLSVSREAVLAWARASAENVARYYGRPPIRRVLVMVLPGNRRAVGFGTTLGNGGASIMIWVGPQAREPDLARDWVLTHEMVHLAFPNVLRRHFWLEEGISTYVEPIARARAGRLAVSEVWRGLLDGLPKGQPGPGDAGLDGTRAWGRTYWGGAIFCFLADLEIRQRTNGRKSLDDALRGIVEAGGSIAVRWDLQRALRTGDRATGTDVLQRLYERLGLRAETVDLAALFKQLGVRREGDTVVFDDDAPLAAVRKAIASAPAPSRATGGR